MGEIARFEPAKSLDGWSRGMVRADPERGEPGFWVRHSDHLADKAAELEDLAGEFEERAATVEAMPTPKPDRGYHRGRAVGLRVTAATRLRERAAELRNQPAQQQRSTEEGELTSEERAPRDEEIGVGASQCPHCEGGMDAHGGIHLRSCPLAQPSPSSTEDGGGE